MDLDLPPEHAAFRDTVRELAQEVALPLAAEVDRDHRFPEEAVTAAAEAGVFGVLIPRGDGGAGLGCPWGILFNGGVAQGFASLLVKVDFATNAGRQAPL